ncbi:hypothetical protein TrCOL_g12170 [Triparma columacea]|uniref:Protein YIPF n=1 Tax=Triparma columacea TaxID=722753 RepID=A0A9W7FXP6_9STRA|nr:hypothetical protein TrCOL_g12170 [Triparma columacea]
MDGAIDTTPSTLDEPISETIMRDLRQVSSKLRVVLIPSKKNTISSRYDHEEVLKQLKDWDLWGPLLVCLLLSIFLSVDAGSQGALVFSAVFLVVWSGAAIVTINAQLLGGTISFFQSVCVLGYCVFPLTVVAGVLLIVHTFLKSLIFDSIFVALAFIWSTRASVVFIGQFISEERKVLAVFPVFFFYVFLSWMILI